MQGYGLMSQAFLRYLKSKLEPFLLVCEEAKTSAGATYDGLDMCKDLVLRYVTILDQQLFELRIDNRIAIRVVLHRSCENLVLTKKSNEDYSTAIEKSALFYKGSGYQW